MDTGFDCDRGDSGSERVYRALMRAYPQEVRRRYAEEMVRYFGDLCREERMSRGHIGVALLWARTLPELLFTALEERGAQFRGNAYLPVAPRTVARWGALCALLGGSLGVAYHLINSLLGALNILTGDYSYGNDLFTMFFTLSLFLCALSLSSLGLFGLYGAVVARSGRPGLVAGAGAIFSGASAVLWLATSGYAAINRLALGSALFAPFEWLWNMGTFVIPKAILFWFLGLLLLGIAAAREGSLPRHLRVLPLALFTLIVPSYWLGRYFEMDGNPVTVAIVMGIAQSLPFVGVTLLGWVLLKDYDAEPLAVSGGPVESAGATRGMVTSVSRTTSKAREERSGTYDERAAKEKELLEALRRRGALTAAGVALETSLSVEEADRMLSALAAQGHLEVRVERGRLLYSFWESDG